MLSSEKFQKLTALTDHPKFGKLLKQAITNWEKYNPERRTFGVSLGISIYEKSPYNIGCCLVGSALLGKDSSDSHTRADSMRNLYNISEAEFWGLSDGFDNREYGYNIDLEAYEFGERVGKICFEE